MVGNICGILTLSILGAGLKAAASPGNIIAEMLMTPKGSYFANIAGIAIAAVVSFVLAVVLLKMFGKDGDLEAAQQQVAASKAPPPRVRPSPPPAAPGCFLDRGPPAFRKSLLSETCSGIFPCQGGPDLL